MLVYSNIAYQDNSKTDNINSTYPRSKEEIETLVK